MDITMNIIKFQGGIGNQMFQYALFRKFEELGNETYMDFSSYQNDTQRSFALDRVFPKIRIKPVPDELLNSYLERNRKRSVLEKATQKILWGTGLIIREKRNGVYDATVLKLRDKLIEGYWQTEKYWSDISCLLKEEFCFPSEKESRLIQLLELIQSHKNSISIHVRRGDYLEQDKIYGNICTEEYYKRALTYLSRKIAIKDAAFFVFSDDILWVKKNFKLKNVIFISKDMFLCYEDWYDMFLMSHCKYNIIANSSFSWWGAWLNEHSDKCVIAPAQWDNRYNTRDIWCKGWIRI